MTRDGKEQLASLGVDEILLSTARGLLQAQRAMDSMSLETERRNREAGVNQQPGMATSWYTIPELALDLRLALSFGTTGELQTDIVDADYQSRYGFDVRASSELHTKFVAVPPIASTGIHLRDEAEVLRRVGRLKRVVEAWDVARTPRFVTRYRPFVTQGYSGGIWHVLLVDRLVGGGVSLLAWAAVDDQSGELLRLWVDSNDLEGP